MFRVVDWLHNISRNMHTVDYNFSGFFFHQYPINLTALKYPEISVQDTKGPRLFQNILLELFYLE